MISQIILASEVVGEFLKLSEESFQSDDIGIKINELEEDLMDFEVIYFQQKKKLAFSCN